MLQWETLRVSLLYPKFWLKIGRLFLSVLLITSLVFTDVLNLLTGGLFSTKYFGTETTYADDGDFSIYREVTGTDSVTTSLADVTWDTTVTESSNITLSGGSNIDLSEGGKYLVLYNVWTFEGGSTGNNRRGMETSLSLGGSTIPYGYGAGYIRDSENDLNAYNSGAAIVEASAGDDLKVQIQRFDNNSGAGVEIRNNTNGISVLKIPDSLDYLRLQRTTDILGVNASTTFSDLAWNQADEVDTDSFSFSPTDSDITLKGGKDKFFLVTANVNFEDTSGGGVRQNYEMRLTLDGSEIPGTRTTTYLRYDNNVIKGTTQYVGLIKKTAIGDQTLNVEIRNESTAGSQTQINGGQTAIAIAAMNDGVDVISLTNTSAQTLTTSQSVINFDEQIFASSSAFTHSTTSNPSRITVNVDEDYLFFSTAYTSRTSGTARDVPRFDWRTDGSAVTTYGGHGSFNRGAQGSEDTYTSGSAGGLIFNGLTDGQYVEILQSDETTGTPNAEFADDGVALQAVVLNDKFFGTDVVVSATGTQTLSPDIPSTGVYLGGAFVIAENNASRNVTNISITESGSIDGSSGLANIKLYYDLDTSNPYDCSSESYSGGESQFGSTDTNGFSGANGVSSFTGTVGISTTQALCVYVVADVTDSANDGETIEISINNPTTDVAVTSGGTIVPDSSVNITGSTTVRNAELSQTHYRWLNDDGVEGSASAIENEDTSAIGFANGTTRRLRLQVDAAGSTSSLPTTFQLEFATKTAATCGEVSSWSTVGSGGADWIMSSSGFITDGNDATNIGTGSGGLSDPSGASFLGTNGGLRDTSAQTGSLTLTSSQYVEFEFAVEPSTTAPQGTTYCFRLTDNGSELRNYATYAEGTISADVNVSASSTHIATVETGSTTAYLGGIFVIERPGTARTLTNITVTETGTVDAGEHLRNPRLYFDLDTNPPYDCTGESYSNLDSSVAGSAFTGPDGSTTFTGSVSISTNQSFCAYLVVDVAATSSDGQTIKFEINDPSSDVVVTSSSVGPSTAVSPTGSTTISGSVLTQQHYHWRNDDGNETGATSATGGSEDTPLLSVPKETTYRLRLGVSNEGGVDAAATNFRLEYGTKVSTCDLVNTWFDVGAVGGAWDMSLSSNIADGNTTDVTPGANGEITNENTTIDGVGALRETTSETGAITLSTTEFTELEYSIEATEDSGYDTDYCFRVTDSGSPLPIYINYPELTTREKQDFFIQRDTETISGTSITLTAGVDYIAPSATTTAFVRITDSHMTGAANNLGTDGQNADDVTAYISDQSDITSSFTISRPSSATSNTRVDWEIVEFIGLPGTDNEIVVRGVGEVAFATSEFIDTGAVISDVVDDDDVAVFITGQRNNDTGRTNYNDGLFTANWSTTTSQPEFERGDADSTADVSYAVVEFTGANWKIQRVEHTYTAAGSTETESMTAINSISRAFVHAQKRVGEGLQSIDEGGHLVYISSIGAVSFYLHGTAETPTDHTSIAWVFENTQIGNGKMNVYQQSGALNNPDPEPATYSISIGATVNTTNASIFGNNYTVGTGTTYPRLHTGFTIASSTHIEVYRSDTNNDMEFRSEVVEWPVTETSVRQNYYRFYVDNDSITPTTPWPAIGTPLGENTTITAADDPLGEGERVRIRMSLKINNATLPQNTKAFKLQYGLQETTCSAISVWTDVGAPGSGTIWRGYNTSLSDGTEVATSTPATGTLLLTPSDVAGTFEEQNNSAVNPYSVDIGQDVEYDWVVEHNGAAQRSDYCFRIVNSDDSEIDGYINYPTIRTTGYTPISWDWRWFDDVNNETPSSPLAALNVAPIDIANEDVIKLRVIASEVENAVGSNIKFALQYSQYADFSDGGTFVTSTSSCLASSTWCYADGAGVDNEIIQEKVLTNADGCTGGVGIGCGTHNEAQNSISTLTHVASANTEFEFTISNAAARANGVYYFRLYDVNQDEPLVASSSYPSLVTEGAQLVFSVAGLPAATTTAGVTTDYATTPSAIGFNSLPFDSSREAAQRISVTTNATEGYKLYMYAGSQLLNSYGDSIPAITATNAVPAGWATACSGAATGCFGYHTTDATLDNGSARFSPIDSYAALETTPQEIMYSSIPIIDVHDVIYRVQVSEQQTAGDYETDIVYIAVPTF